VVYGEEVVAQRKQLAAGLPANIDAEKTILGAILLDNDAFFADCCEDLQADDFSLDSHRRLYLRMSEIMSGMVEGAHNVDIVTLANELARNKEVNAVGGVAYIASLTEGLPRRPVIDEYVRIVKDKAKLRKIMLVCSAGIARAADQSEDAIGVLESIQGMLEDVEADQPSDAVQIGAIAPLVEASILARRNQNLTKTALDMTWGIEALDVKTKGVYGGELTIIAADSSGGKTQAFMQMALANAQEGTPVGIFSLEMPAAKLVQRLYPLMSDIITAEHIRDPRLLNRDVHLPELARLTREIAKLKIFIDDTSPMTIQKLRARAKMMRRRHGVRMIGVDYLQLLECPGKIGVDETRGIVFGLRDLAKGEPDTAIVALSQFSKEQGFVKKRRRTKGDLYGGSAIHHAAQNIVIITIEDSEKRDPGDDLDVEIMVDKSREGARGRVTCTYDRKKLKFISAVQKEMGYGSSTDASSRSAAIGQ
jgi:replicative DNA helicase